MKSYLVSFGFMLDGCVRDSSRVVIQLNGDEMRNPNMIIEKITIMLEEHYEQFGKVPSDVKIYFVKEVM